MTARFPEPGRSTLLSALLLAVGSLAACGESEDAYRCDDCNVLLISVDTLRSDHLSLYGYERPTSPFLEELGEDSVVFEQMVNNGGGTLPVHLSMLTSLTPLAHNVLPDNNRKLEEERVTLAEQLLEQGYRTGGFTDKGWVRGRFGFAQGFEAFDDAGGRLKTIMPKVFTWLEAHRKSKFFLFLHTYDVHSEWKQQPYDCPGDYPLRYDPDYGGEFDGCIDGRCASTLLLWLNERQRNEEGFDLGSFLGARTLEHMVARYDGCINYVDDQLRQLVDRLKEWDLYDRTMIVITSDHGEEFLDHGRLLHQNRAYEELVHIPLIIKFPDSRFGGKRVRGIASTIDLMPTILDVVDVPINDQAMGVSLVPLAATGRPVRNAVHIFNALRTERWKLIVEAREELKLFDVASDPAERTNLFSEEQELALRMRRETRRLTQADRKLYADFLAGAEADREPLELTPEEIEDLKGLGYLQ